MKFEELRFVCEEAARDVVARGQRPVPPTMVLPGADRTRLLTLTGFPEDDEARHEYLVRFAHDQITQPGVPAWGFLAEAEVGGHDAVAIVYGARRHAPEVSAAPLGEDGLGEFLAAEELDPTAMPFLHPLQHAVDALPAVEGDEPEEGGGLPIFGG
jgi:hypothetical protein